MPKIATHPSSSFSLATVHLIQVMSVLAPINQKEIGCKRAALWVQTKGPSSTALPPAQSQGSSVSKSRSKAAATTLHLWTAPPSSDHACSGGFSAQWGLVSQWLAVVLRLSKGLPSPTLSLLSFWPTHHPQVRDCPGLTCYTRHQLWAWLWFPTFVSSWIFVLKKPYFSQCVCVSDDFMC